MQWSICAQKFALAAAILLSASGVRAADTFKPGELWPDDQGKHIQAHGGGVIHVGDTYYWFGEDRSPENAPGMRCVSCYASQDLLHWTHRGQVFKTDHLEDFGRGWVLERPKVFYNAKTQKYVMYLHIDGPFPGHRSGYELARAGVAVSDTVDGNYQYLKSFRPLNHESRDIGQFIDDDGTAYLIFEDRPNGFHIARLSDD